MVTKELRCEMIICKQMITTIQKVIKTYPVQPIDKTGYLEFLRLRCLGFSRSFSDLPKPRK